MDVSSLFKSSVSAVSLYNKVSKGPDSNLNLKLQKKQSLFSNKIQTIATQIRKLYQLLSENQQSSLNFKHLPNNDNIANINHDDIDLVLQNIMSKCSKLINELKREMVNCELSHQNQEHRDITILLIEEYLKQVFKIYSDQKAMRIKKAIELKKISKLQPVSNQKEIILQNDFESNASLKVNKNVNKVNSLKVQEINEDINEISLPAEEQLSPQDIQILEAENQLIYNDLNILTEDIRQIENNVAHVAELQGIFTEKVLDQDKNVDHVLTVVVGSTENVKEANEEIRKAIQRNAGLRVWLLFVLIVMSFTLIFLDWYN